MLMNTEDPLICRQQADHLRKISPKLDKLYRNRYKLTTLRQVWVRKSGSKFLRACSNPTCQKIETVFSHRHYKGTFLVRTKSIQLSNRFMSQNSAEKNQKISAICSWRLRGMSAKTVVSSLTKITRSQTVSSFNR